MCGYLGVTCKSIMYTQNSSKKLVKKIRQKIRQIKIIDSNEVMYLN